LKKGAWLLTLGLALSACDTTTDVVIGKGPDPGGVGGVPPVEATDNRNPFAAGGAGAGGVSAGAASMGSGGVIMDFPAASGGGQGGCATVTEVTALLSRDVYVIFDQSSSMNVPLPAPGAGTWGQAADEAFVRFVSDSGLRGYGVGLQVLPLGDAGPPSCTDDYSTPAVPVAALPANGPLLLAAMQSRTPSAFMPLGPALGGAITHMDHLSSGRPLVLLVTDRLPSECQPRDVAGVAAIARNGLDLGGVSTHVVGLNLGAAGENLHAIAEAGGTGRATLIDASADVAEDLYQAMRSVLRSPSPCRWTVPPPPNAGLIPEKMGVYYRLPESPDPHFIPRIGSSAQCQGDDAPGWYVGTNGPAGVEVVLCPRSCAQTRDADDVAVVFGCGGPTAFQ
jgi:hypothetical protein